MICVSVLDLGLGSGSVPFSRWKMALMNELDADEVKGNGRVEVDTTGDGGQEVTGPGSGG